MIRRPIPVIRLLFFDFFQIWQILKHYAIISDFYTHLVQIKNDRYFITVFWRKNTYVIGRLLAFFSFVCLFVFFSFSFPLVLSAATSPPTTGTGKGKFYYRIYCYYELNKRTNKRMKELEKEKQKKERTKD